MITPTKRHRADYDAKRDTGYEPRAAFGWGERYVADLLKRLKAYRVDWKFSFVPGDDMVYEPGIDREVADLEDANVISSELQRTPAWGPNQGAVSHAVLLDIDYAAWLIPSSTEGHSHLYIDVPGGVPHEKYMELLKLLAECRIIEQGYADVSIARGHSDLRLPWVSKADQKTDDNSGEKRLAEVDKARRDAEVEEWGF